MSDHTDPDHRNLDRTDPDAADPDRRKLLGSAAVIGGALPLLAACGDGGDSDPSGSESRSDGEPAGDEGTEDGAPDQRDAGVTVRISDVPVGRGTILKDEKIVVTQPKEGEFRAFSAICTHNQCVVSEITEQAIICHCHESHYDLSTGEVLEGPAPKPLPEKAVRPGDGSLDIG